MAQTYFDLDFPIWNSEFLPEIALKEINVIKMLHCVVILLIIMNMGFGCGCI